MVVPATGGLTMTSPWMLKDRVARRCCNQGPSTSLVRCCSQALLVGWRRTEADTYDTQSAMTFVAHVAAAAKGIPTEKPRAIVPKGDFRPLELAARSGAQTASSCFCARLTGRLCFDHCWSALGRASGPGRAFVPVYATAMFVNDSITAILLYAQFSILRSRATLVNRRLAAVGFTWSCQRQGA